MPTTFFDLPREIRDLIYEYVLVSPTGFIEPVTVQQFKKSPNPLTSTQFALFVRSPPTSPYDNEYHKYLLCAPITVSLSISRTCRQIYAETEGLFWTRNTVAFASSQTLVQTLKTISQIPSRLITRITIPLSLSNKSGYFPRALRLLASRARHGAFRHLTLTATRRDLIGIEGCKMSSETKRVLRYDNLLENLREGGKEVKFEKEMRVETLLKEWRIAGGMDHDTVRELHLAWGGRMMVNGELEWVDFVHMGRCAGVA